VAGTNEPGRSNRSLPARWRSRAQEIWNETYALSYAFRDPRTPWYAKAWLGLVVAYAFSPIDLIPDFIPLFGLLDDLVLVPLGVALAIKLVPAEVLAAAREQVRTSGENNRPRNLLGAILVLSIWLVVLTLAGILISKLVLRRRG
jgi:uncharacterized membrane protein YkvA (DUF1232 family)